MPRKKPSAQPKWKRTTHALWRLIVHDERLKRLPPKPTVIFSDKLDATVCAQIQWHDSVVITISARFIAEVHEELLNYSDALVRLATGPGRRSPRSGRVLKAIEELIVSFIMLHEIFHLVGGHVEWMSSRTELLSFDERRLGLFSASGLGPGVTKRPSYRRIARAYLLESEADCTALQWIVQSTYPPCLKLFLGRKAPVITSLPPVERLVGFRLVFTAVWLALRRMEASRTRWMVRNSPTHPLPAARLFAAVGTLLQEYSSISSLRFDAEGGGHHTLSASDVETMTTFLRRILSPVLVADWNPDKDVVPRESLEALMVRAFPDFANHMLNRRPKTEVGREVVRMERERPGMYKELAPYRYFPVIRLRPRKR